MADLTVFVGTFNRIGTLSRCVEALERQRRPKRIVIVDNGSDHPGALWLLAQLADRHAIYRMPRIEDVPRRRGGAGAHGGHGMQAVERNYSEAFRREWETQPRPRWYAVTDADVWLDGDLDSLDAYVRLAEETGRAIGPHLRLDTHPNYPLRAAAIIQHARILFRADMDWVGGVPISYDPIDSTFHLFRAGRKFRRLRMETARVGPPYMATHSDWLIDFENPTVENHAYILGAGDAASWGGRWIRDVFAAYLRSPEEAYELVSLQTKTHDDYFYPGFMLAWMLQYGHGCDADREQSVATMRAAIPEWSPCVPFAWAWEPMVYDGDFSCLGWDVEPAIEAA